MPGNYVLRADHPTWKLTGPKEGIPITLEWESVMLKPTYTIEGRYFISMLSIILIVFRFQAEWGSSLEAATYQKHSCSSVSTTVCEDRTLKCQNKYAVAGSQSTCYNHHRRNRIIQFWRCALWQIPYSSIVDLLFCFMCVTCLMLRSHEDKDVKYGFEPDVLELFVPLGDMKITDPIQIVTFSVSGFVSHKGTGEGIENVDVIVNGKHQSMETALHLSSPTIAISQDWHWWILQFAPS